MLFDKLAKFHWNLVTVYGDAQTDGKEVYLAKLSRTYHDNRIPCVIGEGFDIIRYSADKNKPTDTDDWSFVFNAIIENFKPKRLLLLGLASGASTVTRFSVTPLLCSTTTWNSSLFMDLSPSTTTSLEFEIVSVCTRMPRQDSRSPRNRRLL